MKLFNTLFTFLILSSGISRAQDGPSVNGYKRLPLAEQKVVYLGIVPIHDVDQAKLLARARQWVAKAAVDARDTARVYNPATGTITFHGFVEQPPIGAFKDANSYDYYFTIDVKDGKYRYRVDRFQWAHSQYNMLGEVIGANYVHAIERLGTLPQKKYVEDRALFLDTHIKQLIASLAAVMYPDPTTTTTW